MLVTDNKYYVSEIFESIQGEGNYAGVYGLFIRFHFCNLTCSWCDTKYTWYEKSGTFKEYSAEELKDIITKSRAHHVIFTGGEPILYRLDRLVTVNKIFHVETNATIIPIKEIKIQLNDKTEFIRGAMDINVIGTYNWVVSPKLSNSGQSINEETMLFWANQIFRIFKFIIKTKSELNEVEEIIDKFAILRQKVYIGLEGTTLQSQLRHDMIEEIIASITANSIERTVTSENNYI